MYSNDKHPFSPKVIARMSSRLFRFDPVATETFADAGINPHKIKYLTYGTNIDQDKAAALAAAEMTHPVCQIA